MSRMVSLGAGLRAGRGPAALRRTTARWAVGGMAAAVTVAGGLAAAPSAAAVTITPVPCGAAALGTAISGASSNAILVLASNCVYHLTAALPVITVNLTITGTHDTITAQSGTPYTMLTNDGASVAINHVTFADGRAITGSGAIANQDGGTLALTNDTFRDNRGPTGGAVLNGIGGGLTVASSYFDHNHSWPWAAEPSPTAFSPPRR